MLSLGIRTLTKFDKRTWFRVPIHPRVSHKIRALRKGVPLFYGGGEGNRTPVQKPLDTTFSGCSLSFSLFRVGAGKQAPTRSNRFVRDRLNGHHRCTFTAEMTLSPEPRYSREERAVRRPQHCHCQVPKDLTIRQP